MMLRGARDIINITKIIETTSARDATNLTTMITAMVPMMIMDDEPL